MRCELDVNVYRTIPEKINSALITYQICYKCYRHQKSQTSNNNSCDPGNQCPRQSASEPNLRMTPGDPSSVVHNEGDHFTSRNGAYRPSDLYLFFVVNLVCRMLVKNLNNSHK